MDATVLTAIISTIGIIIVAIIGYFSKRDTEKQKLLAEKELAKIERELDFQTDALTVNISLRDWDLIYKELNQLMEASDIDRFLILAAWNGIEDPKWTTAIFQYRRGDQNPISYVHVELDKDYCEKLRLIRTMGEVDFSTEELMPSLIKSIYEMEGIKYSAWYHINSKRLSDTGSTALRYCSFATHSDKVFSDADKINCRRIVGMLKGALGHEHH